MTIPPSTLYVFPAQKIVAFVEFVRRKSKGLGRLRMRYLGFRCKRRVVHELPQRHRYAASRAHSIDQPFQHAHA